MKKQKRSGKSNSSVLLELDGPEMTPRTVDSVLLLQLAESFFRLAIKVGDADGVPFELRGLKVLDKCVAVAATPTKARPAYLATSKAVRVIRGEEDVPAGAEGDLRSLIRGLRSLDTGVTAKVLVGNSAKKLEAPSLPTSESPWETTELRVTPLRVGGKDLRAEFRSDSELHSFVLSVKSLDIARCLGASLHGSVDIVANICRGIDGRIERGEVVDAKPLESDAVLARWQDWFASDCDTWTNVEDVGAELERYH